MEWIALIIIAIVLIVIIIIVLYVFTGGTPDTIGSPCTDVCVDPLICDNVTKTCKVKIMGPCTQHSDCVTGSSCMNGVCLSAKGSDSTPLTTPLITIPPTEKPKTVPLVPIRRIYSSSSSSSSSFSSSDDNCWTNDETSTWKSEDSVRQSSYYDSSDEYTSDTIRESSHSVKSESSDTISKDDSEIDDIIEHNSKVFILKDNKITCSGKHIVTVNKAESIHSFNGNLYILDRHGVLNSFNEKTRGIWQLDTPVKNITHIDVTGKHMWIQNGKEGCIVDSDMKTVNKVSIENYKRIQNKEAEIDVHNGYIIVRSEAGETKHDGIYAACLNNEGGLVVCRDPKVKRIRIINGESYFIRGK